jgi:FtsH-binding integral membrane protein
MTPETRRHAGILIVIIPTVIYGGVSILGFLIHDPAYMQNPLRQNLFRAGHAHAGVLLILSLVAYLYVDDANLSPIWKTIVKAFIPSAAIFLPAAFFFSVLSADATKPNGFIYFAYVGVVLLVTGLLALGIGLIRSGKNHK